MRKFFGWIVLVLGGIGLILGIVLIGSSRTTVDWRRIKAVAFESDDWGLAGFVPDTMALAGLDRHLLNPGRFPEVYWGSTLEDSATVIRLADMMVRFRDQDGLPPVFQANYIMSSFAYEQTGSPTDSAEVSPPAWEWRRYDLPQLPPLYQRPGMWPAVNSAVARGVWRPEFHGSFHYDPDIRKEAVHQDVTAQFAAERGVLVFPGASRTWELGPRRDTADLATELDRSFELFENLFGREPTSIIAPDYVWDGRCEKLWSSRGLNVIQAKREQRHPRLRGGGWVQRFLKVVERVAMRFAHPGRSYLERNCRLEAAQTGDWRQIADDCRAEILQAWRRGEPAIVESHRVNYVHLQPEVAEDGFQAMARLLELLTQDGSEKPLFLTDTEIAQLARTGTSWCVRGPYVVVRNYSRSRRMVAVPGVAYVPTAHGIIPRISPGAPHLISIAPASTLLMPVSLPDQGVGSKAFDP